MSVKEAEEKILKFWEEKRVYEKLKELRKNKEKFYFLDGPPYATGYIHVGTAMNKVIKDCYIRFFRMRGFNVWDQPGYDTHGVPIENKVEKELGFKSKRDIEEFGVEEFIKRCKEFATRFINIMGNQFKNLGVWMDWNNPYLTLTNEYIEGAWFTFKKAFEKGFLYKGVYPVHVCPRCSTAVAYNEIEYKKVEDPSIYVKFPLKDEKNEFLVIWTTTPWTLPSNTGIMVHPSFEYARVKIGNEVWVVAKNLVEKLMEEFGVEKYEIIEVKKGEELIGKEYTNPIAEIFPFTKKLKSAYRVVGSEKYVSLEEGTGLVHSAPGHGKEDFEVGKENGLPVVNPLRMDGCFNEESGILSGIFAKEADKIIIEELRKRNVLIKEGKIVHEYPFCWRCDSPLLLMTVPQWFFRVTAIRDKLIKENKKVNWVPKWAGERFKNWLESLGDWPISRQRYWGIPLPIWVCEKCDKIKVIGSRKELPEQIDDLHKPYIDNVILNCECGGKMRRIPDVLDVWFDSGVAPWASLGYPTNEKLFKELWPVKLVIEGPDQIRGWWNSMMITGIMTFGRRPFESVLFHGFVLDAHGTKMSKSRGNIVTTEEVIEKYGRDILRFYYLSNQPWNDCFFKWDEIEQLNKSFIVIRNTFKFVETYVKEKGSKSNLKKEDEWIISKLNSLIENCTNYFNKLLAYKAATEIKNFILNDFSRWYIKLIRDRVWPEYKGRDKEAAYFTLLYVTERLIKLLAPFCPFLVEETHQRIIKKFFDVKESIHLEDWPDVERKMVKKDLEEKMEIVRKITETSYAARQKAKLKLRWPVKEIIIVSKKDEVKRAVEDLKEVLIRASNSKEVKVMEEKPVGKYSGENFEFGEVFVSLEMDENLRKEAIFRELIRRIQEMRKKEGLTIEQRIILFLNSSTMNEELKKNAELLMKEVGAEKIEIGRVEGKIRGKLEVLNERIEIAFEKK